MPRIIVSPDELVSDPQTSEFTASSERIYRLDLAGGNLIMHLPTASGINGKDIGVYVDYDGSNEAHIVPSGVETINGGSGLVLTQRQSVFLTSTGDDDWIGFGTP